MGRKGTRRSHTPGSCEIGFFKRKQLDPSDNEMSRELESDDMPKSCWIKEEIQRVVREELKPVKSDLKEAKKDLKLLISHLTHIFGSRIPDTVKGKRVQLTCSSVKDDDTIQGEVREESEHSSSQSVRPTRSSGKRRKRDEVRKLQLRFKEPLPTIVYTDKKLAIHVELVDAKTGNIVDSGRHSSVGVEVVVLEGNSGTVGNGEKSVAKDRPGKGPLLIGDHKVNLKGGSGLLNVQFTQVSRWSESGKFRLAVSTSQTGFEHIHEVISEPISVKAGRGEAFKKSDRPQPDDEVWRLNQIGRNGRFCNRLEKEGIRYVREFVQLLNTDENKLRKILGETMTDNKWNILKAHAEQCCLNEERNADKFSPMQENHEDTIGKPSSSLPSQVSERQTENPAPVQHDMAPRAPVGLDAPQANARSTAEGHNEFAPFAPHQPISANNQNGLIFLGDNGINTGGLPTQPHDANSLFAMPIQMTGSRCQIVNEHGLPYAPTSVSTSSFRNGHNELAPLAPHQPTSASNRNSLIFQRDNGITVELPNQSHDANSQFAMPSHGIGSSSRMDFASSGNFPPCGPSGVSLSNFQNGHNELAPLSPHQPTSASNRNSLIFQKENVIAVELPNQSHDANSQFAMPSHGIGSSSRMDFASSENFPLCGPSGVSLSNFQNGYNGATACPSLPQSQITCVGNRMEFLANGIACPAAVPPTSANLLDGQFSLGEDDNPTLGSPTQFPVDNSEDAARGEVFVPWRENPISGHNYTAFEESWPTFGYDQETEDIQPNAAYDRSNYSHSDLPNVDQSFLGPPPDVERSMTTQEATRGGVGPAHQQTNLCTKII